MLEKGGDIDRSPEVDLVSDEGFFKYLLFSDKVFGF